MYVCVGVYVQIHNIICIFKKKEGRGVGVGGGGADSVSIHHPELIKIPGGPLV